MRDNERVEEEGRKARKFVEKLSWDNLTDEFEKVLEGVICGRYVLSWAFNAICNKQFYKLFRYLDHIIRTYGTKKRTI